MNEPQNPGSLLDHFKKSSASLTVEKKIFLIYTLRKFINVFGTRELYFQRLLSYLRNFSQVQDLREFQDFFELTTLTQHH